MIRTEEERRKVTKKEGREEGRKKGKKRILLLLGFKQWCRLVQILYKVNHPVDQL